MVHFGPCPARRRQGHQGSRSQQSTANSRGAKTSPRHLFFAAAGVPPFLFFRGRFLVTLGLVFVILLVLEGIPRFQDRPAVRSRLRGSSATAARVVGLRRFEVDRGAYYARGGRGHAGEVSGVVRQRSTREEGRGGGRTVAWDEVIERCECDV